MPRARLKGKGEYLRRAPTDAVGEAAPVRTRRAGRLDNVRIRCGSRGGPYHGGFYPLGVTNLRIERAKREFFFVKCKPRAASGLRGEM
jgi:hypothetical protein